MDNYAATSRETDYVYIRNGLTAEAGSGSSSKESDEQDSDEEDPPDLVNPPEPDEEPRLTLDQSSSSAAAEENAGFGKCWFLKISELTCQAHNPESRPRIQSPAKAVSSQAAIGNINNTIPESSILLLVFLALRVHSLLTVLLWSRLTKVQTHKLLFGHLPHWASVGTLRSLARQCVCG